jgi:cell division septum initiation protein DivIVA
MKRVARNDTERIGMLDKEVRKLKRVDFLRIIQEQEEIIEKQNKEIEDLKHQLNDKVLLMEQAGNIAQASLAINQVMEAAQKAADQYLESVKALAQSMPEQNK